MRHTAASRVCQRTTRVTLGFFSRCFAQAAYDEVWGEHEVDYILICRPKRMVRLNVNANEVAEVRAFAADELRAWVEGADAR